MVGRTGVVPALIALGLVAAIVAGYWVLVLNRPASPAPSTTLPPKYPQHIFVIVQENHGFDNYFGRYCPSVNSSCPTAVNGIPSGLCLPFSLSNPQLGCQPPYVIPNSTAIEGDLNHNHSAAVRAYNNGRMDGFVQANGGSPTTMGSYDARSVSVYWDMAQQYGLGESFFSGALGGSNANHWLLFGGSAPAGAVDGSLPVFVQNGNVTPAGTQYLNGANGTVTVADELQAKGISWSVYDHTMAPGGYSAALQACANATGEAPGTTFDEHNPLSAKGISYTPAYLPHFVSRYAFPYDVQTGEAPNVSWVISDVPQSEHPPGDLLTGETWAVSLVNAVEQSPIWDSSLIFLTWDDWGGWYDHVAPPNEATLHEGFRMPLLVIGPYVRPDYVSSQFAYFPSIPHFIEQRYGLAPTAAADGSAPGLLDYFNFGAPARAPLWFSVNGTYPMAPSGVAASSVVPTFTAPGAAGLPNTHGAPTSGVYFPGVWTTPAMRSPAFNSFSDRGIDPRLRTESPPRVK